MTRALASLLLLVSFLVGCGPREPIRIGFIGGLSSRNSDTGQAGLEGATLAVDRFNRTGGLNGRLVELMVRDDAQDQNKAARAAEELAAAGVVAVIGPFTSDMAEVTAPILEQAAVFEISPTITSMAFYGRDDNLFRINRTTRDNAVDYAEVLTRRGQQKIAVAYDQRNRNFTNSWLTEFRTALHAKGGKVVTAIPYDSGTTTRFEEVIRKMLEGRPDGLFFISGAVDVARLAREARHQAPSIPLGASEWAATEHLLELGGDVVEGLLIVQNFNREDNSPRYREFSEAYFQRFQRLPGYSSVAAHDAATVLLIALRQQRSGESMKAAAQRSGPFPGLQQQIVFDANGDTQRQVYFTEIRSNRYVRVVH